jgi:hypothetical protein
MRPALAGDLYCHQRRANASGAPPATAGGHLLPAAPRRRRSTPPRAAPPETPCRPPPPVAWSSLRGRRRSTPPPAAPPGALRRPPPRAAWSSAGRLHPRHGAPRAAALANDAIPASGHLPAGPIGGMLGKAQGEAGGSCPFAASLRPNRFTERESWAEGNRFAYEAVFGVRLAQLRGKPLPKLLAQLCQRRPCYLTSQFRKPVGKKPPIGKSVF